MSKKNFKIGEEVICLKETPTMKVGDKNKIEGSLYCMGCGEQRISFNESSLASISRCVCGTLRQSSNKKWHKAENFCKEEDLPSMLEEAVKVEDFDKAIIIRDILNPKTAEKT